MSHPRWIFLLSIAGLSAGCVSRAADAPAAAGPAASFVGRQACAGCHETEDRLWQGSHHDRAMQEAAPGNVLGDFGGATLSHFGVTSTFFQRDGKYFVRTDGPDGKPGDFRVAYTFGVYPLQQYLVEMPGGRLQALPLCWDARPASEGGQRWFHLHPDEPVPAGDALHWTGPNQNWNYMCAECHSTNVRKGYVQAEDRYETTWSEIDVSCEACHGPGSRHVAWARKPEPRTDGGMGLAVRLKDPGRGTWIVDPRTGDGLRLAPAANTGEVETCARCHASRSAIHEPYEPGRPLLESHRPVLLEEGSYFADGQIQGEVYEYGSFLQSRMHAKGVTCSDCHEPHAAKLRRIGNALCTHCHAAAKYDAPAHLRHAAGSSGARCVDCHMPRRTYMVVHARRDHSLRVPRPDLSAKLGAPNACNGCHAGRSTRWAAGTVARWYGPDRQRQGHWGEAIQAGRQGDPGAGESLLRVAVDAQTPGIARATALSLLRRYPGAVTDADLAGALTDADPLVRAAAATAAEALEPDRRAGLLAAALADPVRGVRVEAARVLMAGPPDAATVPGLLPALAEYRAVQEVNADRAEARLNLGWLEARLGRLANAEAAFRGALQLDRTFAPAWVNLAEIYRLQGRDPEGEVLLRQALARAPGDATIHYALGLLLVRRRRLGEATAELARAATLAPREARFAYAYRSISPDPRH